MAVSLIGGRNRRKPLFPPEWCALYLDSEKLCADDDMSRFCDYLKQRLPTQDYDNPKLKRSLQTVCSRHRLVILMKIDFSNGNDSFLLRFVF